MMPYPKRSHCVNGHEYTPENIRVGKDGSRDCLVCERATKKRFVERHGSGASNGKRDMYGATATLVNKTTDARVTIVRGGLTDVAVAEIAEICDGLDGDWRVLCISTPRTIGRDLERTRVRQQGNQVSWVEMPEVKLLGRIGRTDLLDPSLT